MPAIQIRNVPDDLHAELKRRAASQGQSLSEYMLSEARRLTERPTWEEMVARLRVLNADHQDETVATDAVTALSEGRAER